MKYVIGLMKDLLEQLSNNPLSGSTYIELPNELKSSKKGLINIKNNDNKCFIWYHIRHLNPLHKDPQRITKVDKKWLMILVIRILSFLYLTKMIKRLNKKNSICINVFCYENGKTYLIHVSKQEFKYYMDLLLINGENRSHYVYIKNFNKFIFNKAKHKNRKHFCRYCLQYSLLDIVLVVKMFW